MWLLAGCYSKSYVDLALLKRASRISSCLFPCDRGNQGFLRPAREIELFQKYGPRPSHSGPLLEETRGHKRRGEERFWCIVTGYGAGTVSMRVGSTSKLDRALLLKFRM